MISKKDVEIVAHLRLNARKNITAIARRTGIPATTIYDKVRQYEQGIIKRHVALLDFPKLGLQAKAHISMKAKKGSKDSLQEHLMKHPNVNSLYRVNFGSDFMAEVVFRNIAEVEDFAEKLEKEHSAKVQIFSIIEELQREAMFTKPEHFDLVGGNKE